MSLAGQDSLPAGRRISRVILDRENVFGRGEARDFASRLVNRLHATTRAATIRRELLFHAGEPFDSALVAESERNLRRLGVFREVAIDTLTDPDGIAVRVRTADGWSTRPDFRFRSSGDQVIYTVALDEGNLFGTASQAGIRYRKTPDRSSVMLNFRRPRLFGGKVGVDLFYEDRSDGQVAFAQVSQPFFALASPFAFRADVDRREERVLRYYEGEAVARDTLQRRFALLGAAASWAITAGSGGYLRWGVVGQLRREDYVPESVGGPVPETWTAALGPFIQWRRARFVVLRGVRGVGRTEDIDLSTTLQAGINLAPEAMGYEADGFAPWFSGRTGAVSRRGYGYLDLAGNLMMSSAGVDSAALHAAVTWIWRPGGRHFGILHGAWGAMHQPRPGQEFDLGLGLGPRASRIHAFTGDRAFFTSAEYRLTLTDEVFRLTGLGVAAFVDYGGAWYAGQGRRTGLQAGAGFRIASSRSPGVEAVRVDLARRFATAGESAGWAIVIGKGFPFQGNGRLDY